MDREVGQWLLANGGVARTSDLLGMGVSHQALHRMVTRRELTRLNRGVVLCGQSWREAQPSERRRLRARSALAMGADGDLALSHHSSLALGGVPIFGVDNRSHVMSLDGGRRHTSEKVAFHAPVATEWLVPCEQQFRVRDSLAALQVSDAFGVEAGLVSADAVARAGAQQSEFTQALSAGRFARGLARPRQVIEMLNPEMESPGESRCRWLFHIMGMSGAEPQVEFTLPNGRIARVDFYFRDQRTVVEFDGQIKYARAGDLFAEKKREDGLRSLGLEVVRLVWSDLSEPQRVRSLLETAFSRARRMW